MSTNLKIPLTVWFVIFFFANLIKDEPAEFLAGYFMSGFIIAIAAILEQRPKKKCPSGPEKKQKL